MSYVILLILGHVIPTAILYKAHYILQIHNRGAERPTGLPTSTQTDNRQEN